ncbi:hypothetical protein VTO73DRAFT_3384 [Trametes versicolor]
MDQYDMACKAVPDRDS